MRSKEKKNTKENIKQLRLGINCERRKKRKQVEDDLFTVDIKKTKLDGIVYMTKIEKERFLFCIRHNEYLSENEIGSSQQITFLDSLVQLES